MSDACDPASFNPFLGDGSCERPGGGVTVDTFILSWPEGPSEYHYEYLLVVARKR